MTLQEFHSALDDLVTAWAAAACEWSNAEWSLGDFRFVVFSIQIKPEIEVFVQLWSEPLEPVYWEVSSGRWNPPTDKWLAGERSDRILAFGFEIGGRAENFQKEKLIQSREVLNKVARDIVDILYAGFDYRGTARLEASIGYDSRAKLRPVLTSFTPEDVEKVFMRHRHELVDNNHDEDAPVLQFRFRGIFTTVGFADRVPDQHLFQIAVLTCVVPLRIDGTKSASSSTNDYQLQDDTVKNEEISTTLHFKGGVTADWLSERVAAWSAMIDVPSSKIARRRRTSRKNIKVVIE